MKNKKDLVIERKSETVGEIKNKLVKVADQFKEMHKPGNPLILYNIWDVWSALVAENAGAKVLGTSSWAVAGSRGYEDGEKLPFKLALENLKNIIEKVRVPVSFDFEAGFALGLNDLIENVNLVVEAGAIGINFEDQVIGKEKERYSIDEQRARIKAIKDAIEKSSLPNMFINARTDIFLQKDSSAHNDDDLAEAIERCNAYANSGADGFFAPGLANPNFIKQLCDSSPIPVNIMVQSVADARGIVDLGVSRISYGPFPYITATQAFKRSVAEALTVINTADKGL